MNKQEYKDTQNTFKILQSNPDYDFNHTIHSDIPELKKNKKQEVINFSSMNKDMDILDMTI